MREPFFCGVLSKFRADFRQLPSLLRFLQSPERQTQLSATPAFHMLQCNR
jgi:hypothetical protein